MHRVRTDGHLDDPRAALLRLLLTRHPYVTEPPMPGLDPDDTNPAYVAGRTFAVLEQIQYEASGGDLNATYGDRYFAGAVAVLLTLARVRWSSAAPRPPRLNGT